MTARERYSRSGSRAAQEVSSRSSAETCRGHRRPLTLACVLACAAALSIPFALTSHAQNAQRGPIQTPGGGRGPGAAPDANDPANAGADLTPKPPVLPLSPQEEVKRLSLPPGYRMAPVLSDPLIEDPAQIAFDGNGRMFVVELRGYFQTPEGIDLDPAHRADLHARGSGQRWRLRTPFGLRRQAGLPAIRVAVRRQHDPDDGDQRG